MNGSIKRYQSEYGTTGSYLEQGSPADEAEARQAQFQAQRKTDRRTRALFVCSLVVCAACLVFALATLFAPLPHWISK